MPWLCPASKMVSSVLLVCRLGVEVVIFLSPLKNLRSGFGPNFGPNRVHVQ